MKKKIEMIFVFCIALVMPLAVYAIDASEMILSKNNKSERISFLREKGFHGILKQGDLLPEQRELLKENDLFIEIIEVILEKSDRVSEQEIMDCILDDSHSDISREIAIIILMLNNPGDLYDKSDLQNLLDDEKTSFGIKRQLMLIGFQPTDNKKLLEYVLQGEDDELAFQAMEALNRVDPELANQYADLILDEKEKQSDIRIRSAIEVKCKYFMNENAKGIHSEEKKEFIAYLKSLIEENQETDKEQIFYAALIGLSNMKDKDAIRVIIESNIQEDLQRYFIGFNDEVLILMLEENPTLKNIQLFTKGASILPLKEFRPSLEKALEVLSVSVISDEENKEEIQKEMNKINEVLGFIDENNLEWQTN